jgi:flavin reductase (DIM6/NTAB) family NADH-FMN oxidoreductase RutF
VHLVAGDLYPLLLLNWNETRTMTVDFSKIASRETSDNISTLQTQRLLNGAIVPRPVGLVSTADEKGVPNLAPFSFFNVVSIDPAIVIFSPLRRLRDQTQKHTVLNIREVPEAVIHLVSYDMMQQMNLTACDYNESVDEFAKSGFTKEKASVVKPWMVKEARIKLECRIKEMRSMGNSGGAGTVCFAEIVCMHVDDAVLDANGQIDPLKSSPIARLGGDLYSKITKDNLFTMPKPNRNLGIGFDQVPGAILQSKVLTANQLGLLAQVSFIPSIDSTFSHVAMEWNIQREAGDNRTKELHKIAARMLDRGCVEEAWQVLLRSINCVEVPRELENTLEEMAAS